MSRSRNRDAETDWMNAVVTEDDEVEVDRRLAIYPDRYVAWMSFYSLEKIGQKWKAVCYEDGQSYIRDGRSHVMNLIEFHIHAHGRPPREPYVTPGECPF